MSANNVALSCDVCKLDGRAAFPVIDLGPAVVGKVSAAPRALRWTDKCCAGNTAAADARAVMHGMLAIGITNVPITQNKLRPDKLAQFKARFN